MAPRSILAISLGALVALASLVSSTGCGSKPPPKNPEPADSAEADAGPPPPKCEALDEKCAATAETHAKIAHSELVFSPVTGWTYAQMEAVSVAQASDTGPAMAFLGYEGDAKDAKKDGAARDAAFGELTKALGIESKPPKKVNWKKADNPKAIGEMKLDQWVIDKGWTRGGKKGALVIVAGASDGPKSVMAIGFYPDDDKSADDTIPKSFESIGKAK
ncbi:MAG: hypothetical protein U0359_38970 [Byssovorax sp.]